MRRFNYTQRSRIDAQDVLLDGPIGEEGAPQFKVIVDLDKVRAKRDWPESAAILIEAYSRAKYERFDLGTFGSRKPDAPLTLTQFGRDESVLFRVKVVDTEGRSGQILGMADKVRPRARKETPQVSLLPVKPAELDGVVYRVDFAEDRPILQLNRQLDEYCDSGIKAEARSPAFIALVYPQVVREILTKLLVVDNHQAGDEEDGEEDWRSQWLRFARTLNPEPVPEGNDDGEREAWIDVAVSCFGKRREALEYFKKSIGEKS